MKHYIICSGMGYEFKREPFDQFAAVRRDYLAQKVPQKEEAIIDWYSVRSGMLETTQVGWIDGKRASTRKLTQRFDKISLDMYDRIVVKKETTYVFKQVANNVMSIVDLYQAIEACGKANPGSLEEVSVFSHAFFDGPILVNSYDRYGEQGEDSPFPGLRDPLDKDGRGSKDFAPSNMSRGRIDLIRRAFAPSGYVWNWGCNSQNLVHRLLNKIGKSGSLIKDADSIELRGMTREEVDSVMYFNAFFKQEEIQLKRTGRCSLLVRQVKQALSSAMESSYSLRMARGLGIKVVGALPGTYAEFYFGVPKLMHIASSRVVHVSIYQKLFSIELDREKRGYTIFTPGMMLATED